MFILNFLHNILMILNVKRTSHPHVLNHIKVGMSYIPVDSILYVYSLMVGGMIHEYPFF